MFGTRIHGDHPTVSIVTPTFNQARYLPRTLDSVLGQTWAVREHIVVDGGSTDGTLDILERAADTHGIRWSSGPDAGMYDAVNKGLALTSGEIVAYLASDDVYLPWAIETVVRVFERHPSVDLVYGDGITFEEDTGVQILRLYAPFDRASLANYASLLQPAVFWRRRLLERLGGFDANMRYVADLDYWLRVAEAGAEIAHVNEVLAIERVHEGRQSSARREEMRREDAAMRALHVEAGGRTDARRRAATRYMRWLRWSWVRFFAAALVRPLPGPWPRFLRQGDVSIHPLRVLSGLRREDDLRTAMTSRLTSRLVGGRIPQGRIDERPDESPPR